MSAQVREDASDQSSFGPEKGKGGVTGKSHEELIEDLVKNHTVENWVESEEYEASKERVSLIHFCWIKI